MPAITAIASQIKQAAFAMYQGITALGIPSSSILLRKLPKIDEQIDPLPCYIMAPAEEMEERELIDFEGGTELVYPMELCAVVPGNRDFSFDPTIDAYRQLVRQIFYPQDIAIAQTVWTIELKLGALYDRSTLSNQYNYSSMVVRFRSCESGG